MITARAATLADIPAIATLSIETWKSAYHGYIDEAFLQAQDYNARVAGFKNKLETLPPTNAFIVALIGATIVGFASGGRANNTHMEPYSCELRAIYVDQTHQHQGIGRALLAAFARQMITVGATDMILWTLRDGPSHPFYKKIGAETLDKTKDYPLGEKSYACVAYGFPSLSELVQRIS